MADGCAFSEEHTELEPDLGPCPRRRTLPFRIPGALEEVDWLRSRLEILESSLFAGGTGADGGSAAVRDAADGQVRLFGGGSVAMADLCAAIANAELCTVSLIRSALHVDQNTALTYSLKPRHDAPCSHALLCRARQLI
jgi:hypothetical protein